MAAVKGGDDGGLPDGGLLIDYAEAVVRADEDLPRLRAELVARVGPDAAAHTAATVSAFSGLVRVADGTGIPIDAGLAAVSVDLRDTLGLGAYHGAANSPDADRRSSAFASVDDLFDNRGVGDR
jgi:hypothetical protein